MAFVAPLVSSIGTFLSSAGGIAATTGAAAAVSAASAISSGNYQAAVARNNAKIAEANAEAESVAAQQAAQRRDRENAALLAELQARQGANGTSINSRSNAQTRALVTRVGREEATDIARGGASAARRLQQEAANFRGEANRASRQGYLNAVGGLLQTGSLIGRRKRRFQGI